MPKTLDFHLYWEQHKQWKHYIPNMYQCLSSSSYFPPLIPPSAPLLIFAATLVGVIYFCCFYSFSLFFPTTITCAFTVTSTCFFSLNYYISVTFHFSLSLSSSFSWILLLIVLPFPVLIPLLEYLLFSSSPFTSLASASTLDCTVGISKIFLSTQIDRTSL